MIIRIVVLIIVLRVLTYIITPSRVAIHVIVMLSCYYGHSSSSSMSSVLSRLLLSALFFLVQCVSALFIRRVVRDGALWLGRGRESAHKEADLREARLVEVGLFRRRPLIASSSQLAHLRAILPRAMCFRPIQNIYRMLIRIVVLILILRFRRIFKLRMVLRFR